MAATAESARAALREHPHAAALCHAAAHACWSAAARQDVRVALGSEASPVASTPEDAAKTPYGNIHHILERGAQDVDEWLLLGAALASWMLEQPQLSATDLRRCAWLAAYTGCNAWPVLALEAAPELWAEVAAQVSSWAAPEQLALAVALSGLTSEGISELKSSWSDTTPYPTVAACLRAEREPLPLEGELAPPPRRALWVVVQALSGYLFVRWLARGAARWVLGYRSQAALSLSASGLELRHVVTLLGKRWRERRQVVPLSEIASVERDVRYQGVSLYAGLLALVLGTYVGGGLLIDALRVPSGSPSLLGMGLLLIAGGIALDFALSHWGTYRQGRVQLTVRRHHGRGLRLRELDSERCQQLLQELVRFREFEAHPAPRSRPLV